MHNHQIYEVISSEARLKVLHTLAFSKRGLPLRQIEKYTGLAVRSVQVALYGLTAEEVVRKRALGRRTFYSLNSKHPTFHLLQRIMTLVRKNFIIQRSERYHLRAQANLKFSNDVTELLQVAKKV